MPRNLMGGQLADSLIDEAGGLTVGMAVMKGASAGTVKAPTGAGVKGVGVVLSLQKAVSVAGDHIDIVRRGPAVGIAGGVVAATDRLKIGGTNGRLVATTTDNDEIFAESLDDGTDGVEIGIIILQHRY